MKDLETFERKRKIGGERLDQLINDDKLRIGYFDRIKAEVDKFEHDTAAFYKIVNEQIQKIYEDGFLSKLQLIHDKSKEAHNLEKRRFFVRLKKFLFKSRILTTFS